ncbi:MAG: methyltransferase domain-containing protein [Prevotellaceae bacterium]|jgi:SAM-dependent methyltransferase|nr:methyltransferase domain-containing protein [Prevotellaceae bacterium]
MTKLKTINRLIKFFVKRIPRPVLIRFSFLFAALARPFYFGYKVECPICQKRFRAFLPYGNRGYSNRLCPGCLSLERHRLMWLYLKGFTRFFDDNIKVLHIAPEQPFVYRFKKCKNLDYLTADMESPIADMHFDIMQIPLDDNLYDVVFCNHVLEHVKDDFAAMKELYRIMKPGGWAVMQVPIDTKRNRTYEDENITDPKEREKAFGQHDHVRLYGLDYSQRLESAGFKIELFDITRYLSPEQIAIYRLDSCELLYIVRK